MSRTLVLVWIGTAALRQAHEPDLKAWSASRQVVLDAPAEENLPAATHDDALVARVEGLLSEARTAAYGAEPAVAERALSSAELLLRGNPELPEAPWLMAETCAEHAALVRSTDPALAEILLRRARLLGGARALAFTEAAGPAEVASPAEFAVEGPWPRDEVYLDGDRVQPPFKATTGEHHLRVERRGRLAWAGWITAEEDAVRVPVPAVVACSATDLEGARIEGDRVELRAPVLCPEWAVARDAGVDRVEVSVCRPAGCGALLPWSRAWDDSFEVHRPAPPPAAEKKGTSVLLWTGLGVGAAVLAGSFALWQSGAFDREGPPRTTFRITGPGSP